jgi:hypothetical protein
MRENPALIDSAISLKGRYPLDVINRSKRSPDVSSSSLTATRPSLRAASSFEVEEAALDADSDRDVFVSYASQDVVVADAVVLALERSQITCWIAPRDVVPG